MSKRSAQKQDPWIDFEPEMDKAMNELRAAHLRVLEKPTSLCQQELIECAEKYTDLMDDAAVAQQMTLDHPEIFAVSTEEIQRRNEKVAEWERLAKIPLKEYSRIMEKKNNPGGSDPASGVGKRNTAQDNRNAENGDFMQQEFAEQATINAQQDVILGRLHEGVLRMKDTAININEEMVVQESMLDDLGKNMTVLQNKLEGVVGKVGKLLDESSDKNKIICIVVLVVVLGLLVTVLFSGN